MSAVRRWLARGGGVLSPFTIALAYLLLSVSWILFSDHLVSLLPDRAAAERLQSVKGTLFVAGTSVLLFVLVGRYRRSLLREAEDRALERQRRATLDDFLERLRPASTPEATARRICRAVASLPSLEGASYLSVDRDNLFPLAANGQLRQLWPPGTPLPDALGRGVRERTEHGPHIEEVAAGDDGALAAALSSVGLRDAVLAPARHDGVLVGVLVAGAEPPASVVAHLEEVVEVARLAGAWLGPEAVARRRGERRKGELRRAAAAVDIAFQPIVELARGRAVGYEALARFADGVSPAIRFAEAHALGVGLDLEELAIRRSVQKAIQLPEGRWLAINVSAALLLERPRLAAALAGVDRPIVLELTEREPIVDYDCIRTTLAELGPDVRLAIDDVGEAFSGLRHLVELAPAYAKLDLSLVRDVDADSTRQALIGSLRHYTTRTGTELIAEGIESAAERRILRTLGVRLGQGFLFGAPAPMSLVGGAQKASKAR